MGFRPVPMRSSHRVPGSIRLFFCAYSGQKKRGSNDSMADHSPEEQKLLGPGYRGLFLFCMFLLCAFNFADRAIFAVLAQSIRVDLKLTDSDLGLLQTSFGVLYALMGIPIGRLSEHFSRLKIL